MAVLSKEVSWYRSGIIENQSPFSIKFARITDENETTVQWNILSIGFVAHFMICLS